MAQSRHGPRCSICTSRSRAAIEQALAAGLTLRVIAKRYSVSLDAVHRHRHNHLSAEQVAAILMGRDAADVDLPKLQELESERILAEIVSQRIRLREVRDLAVKEERYGLAIAAENSLRSTLELECKLLGPILAPLFGADAGTGNPPDTILRIENIIVKAAHGDEPIGQAIEREYLPREPTDSPEPSTESAPEVLTQSYNPDPAPTVVRTDTGFFTVVQPTNDPLIFNKPTKR